TVLSARIDLVARTRLARWLEAGLQKARVINPERPMIPVGRLLGAREMGRDAGRLVAESSSASGKPAFLIAQQYGRTSLMAFYMPGRPTVYCSSSRSEGRKTQYDIWPQTSLDDPALLGRPAVLIGGKLDQWEPAFGSVVEYG